MGSCEFRKFIRAHADTGRKVHVPYKKEWGYLVGLELIKTDYSTIGPDAPTLNDIFKEIEGYVFLDKQIPNFHWNKFHENAPL